MYHLPNLFATFVALQTAFKNWRSDNACNGVVMNRNCESRNCQHDKGGNEFLRVPMRTTTSGSEARWLWRCHSSSLSMILSAGSANHVWRIFLLLLIAAFTTSSLGEVHSGTIRIRRRFTPACAHSFSISAGDSCAIDNSAVPHRSSSTARRDMWKASVNAPARATWFGDFKASSSVGGRVNVEK